MRKLLGLTLLLALPLWAKDLQVKEVKLDLSKFHHSREYEQLMRACKKREIATKDSGISIKTIKTDRPKINAALLKAIGPLDKISQIYRRIIRKDFLANMDEDHIPGCYSAYKVEVSYLGRHGPLEMFSLWRYEDMGWIHPMETTKHYLFRGDKEIKLADLLEPGGREKLLEKLLQYERLYWAKYEQDAAVMQGDDFPELSDAAKKKVLAEFKLPGKKELKKLRQSHLIENVFYFDQRGLIFLYPPYAIAGYSAGYVELVIPLSELKGIVREEFLH